LTPMIRDNAVLHNRLQDSNRDGQNTLLTKIFPGGNLSLVGSISTGNLARRSIRYLMLDEIDKYPHSAGKEGDPVKLAAKRLMTFGSRKKTIMTCSPTVAGTSRIAKAYANSDMRRPWVPCPICGKFQVLKWPQVRWQSGIARELQPATAYIQCLHCPAHWSDQQRKAVCERAVWRADRPERTASGIVGFWISHLYSPWAELSNMVEEFLSSKSDRNLFQTFVNTVLAEEWQEE